MIAWIGTQEVFATIVILFVLLLLIALVTRASGRGDS
jgi:hypothetical protein